MQLVLIAQSTEVVRFLLQQIAYIGGGVSVYLVLP